MEVTHDMHDSNYYSSGTLSAIALDYAMRKFNFFFRQTARFSKIFERPKEKCTLPHLLEAMHDLPVLDMAAATSAIPSAFYF